MNAKRTAILTILTTMATLVGACDDRPNVPTPAPVAPPASDPLPIEAPRPTTQALLSGTRAPLALDAVPLTLRVPEGWKLDTIAGMTVLNGATPSGLVTVLLNGRSVATATIPLIELGAKEEQKQSPKTFPLAAGRTINELKIFERQSVGRAPSDGSSPVYRWTVTAYAPRRGGTDSSVFELNFTGLTEDVYQADKDFLYSIVNTMTYDRARDPQAAE